MQAPFCSLRRCKKRSFNLAPKSPHFCSSANWVYTVACVYKVQKKKKKKDKEITLFVVWHQFSSLLCFSWGVKLFLIVFISCVKKTLWPFCWGGTVVGTEYKKKKKSGQPDVLTVRKSNKWDASENVGMLHSVVYNLNQSGVNLEIFYNTLGFVSLNFFLRIGFVWLFKTWYFIGVTFCTASCILKKNLFFVICVYFCLFVALIIEYIVLYHHSLRGPSFVVLVFH